MASFFVGIDVAKSKVDVAFTGEKKTRLFLRTEAGLDELVAAIRQRGTPELVAMEATGGQEDLAASRLQAEGWTVAVVNPVRVRAFAKAIGVRAKTDKIDAKLIALFAEAVRPAPRPTRQEHLVALDALLHRRLQLIGILNGEKNRLRELSPSRLAAKGCIELHITFVLDAISANMKRIDALIKIDPVWSVQAKVLMAIPGVGPILTATLLGWLPELGLLTRREIASLVGLAPVPYSSGTMEGHRFTGGGRAKVRSVLYMAAISSIRRPDTLAGSTYHRLAKKGKPKRIALIASARRLLCVANAVVRDSLLALPKTPDLPE